MTKVASGSEVLNELLGGGFEPGIVTTIYGPSASGKTNFCLIAAIQIAKTKKVIFIDTEGGSSKDRLGQLAGKELRALENIFFLKPTNYKEQVETFNKLKDIVTDKIGLVVVDTISMLYRAELAEKKDVYNVNKELGKQLSYLVEIARKKDIPVLIANQVYSDFDNRKQTKMVGGDIIHYSSKCLIELFKEGDKRVAILRKHRSEPRKQISFEIISNGIKKVKKNMFGFLL